MEKHSPARLTGTLTRIHEQGFGFAHVPNGGDFYIHISEMRDPAAWEEGAVVQFRPGKVQKGKATPGYDVVALQT